MIYKVERTVSYYFNAFVEADSKEEAKRLAYEDEVEWEEDSDEADISITGVLVPYDEEGNLLQSMEEVEEYEENGNYVDWEEAEED